MSTGDLLADLAMRRITESINRAAGQHRRAIAQGFASAREAMAHRHRQHTQPDRVAITWLRTFLAAPCGMSGCNVPEGECAGNCLETTR